MEKQQAHRWSDSYFGGNDSPVRYFLTHYLEIKPNLNLKINMREG